MMNKPISHRVYAVMVFLILLVCYGYFMPKWADWGANSRADLVYAFGDAGVLYIDAYHTNTGDKACFPGPFTPTPNEPAAGSCAGHFYSDKSLGPSLLAWPFYGVFKALAALPPVQSFINSGAGLGAMGDTLNPDGQGVRPQAVYEYMALTFISLFTTVIPSALLGVVVFLMATRLAPRHPFYAFLAALIYGLATPAFAYSNVLYQHQMAAFGAFVSFYLLYRVIYEAASLRWLYAVGVLMSLVVITEYPVAIVAGILFIWAAYVLPNRLALWRVIVAGIPLGLVFAAYNYFAFGTPLPVGYEYSTNWQDVHQQGFLSLTAPKLDTLFGLTAGSFRGLFFLAPILLLGLVGMMVLWKGGRKHRSVAVVSALVCGYMLLYNSSSVMWWGGNAVGPRYLVPMLPFLALPLAVVFSHWLTSPVPRLLIGVLLPWSLYAVWVETIAGQAFPPAFTDAGEKILNPLADYSLPLLLNGNIARNYGQILGLHGLASLLPLVVAVVLIVWGVPRWFAWRERAAA